MRSDLRFMSEREKDRVKSDVGNTPSPLPCAGNCPAFNEGCYSQSCGKELHASFRQLAVMVGMIAASALVVLAVVAILSG